MVSKKDDIINVARELFEQYGYAKTTMSDIAMAANVSKASLYYYFKDKTDVFTSVFAALVQRAEVLLQQQLNTCSSTTERVIACLESWGAHQQQITLFGFTGLTENTSDTLLPAVKELWANRLQQLQVILNQGIASGELADISAEDTAAIILNCVTGIYCNMAGGGYTKNNLLPAQPHQKTDEYIRFFVMVFLKGIARV